MKTFLFALTAAIAISNLAQATTQSPEEHLANQVRLEPSIEAKIESAVKKELDAKYLNGFKVLWNTLKCSVVETSELSGQGGGVCTVTAGAMQVSSQVAIVKSANTTTAVVIYADLE